MTKRLAVKFIILLFIIGLVPASYGIYGLYNGEINNGKCINEFVEPQYHKTNGIASVTCSVISDGNETFIIKNMKCSDFKNPVNKFRYEHPYIATYAALYIGMVIAILVSLLSVMFLNKISAFYRTRK